MVVIDNKKFWINFQAGKTPASVKVDNDFWKYFKPGDKILDVGSGHGRIIFECLNRNLNVVGIDINKNEVAEIKKKKLKNAKIKRGDILKIKLKKEFKGVFLLGVLCVLNKEERLRVVKKIRSFLLDNGYLHISEFEVNKRFKSRYDEDFKTTKEYGTLSVKENGKEIFRSHNFTKKEIFDLIKEGGFRVIKFKRDQFISLHGNKKPGMMIIAQKRGK